MRDLYSAGLFRSAYGGETPTSLSGAHSRHAARPSDPALGPFAAARRAYSKHRRIDLFTVRNLTQNHRDFFHLNCVPRQDQSHSGQRAALIFGGYNDCNSRWSQGCGGAFGGGENLGDNT